MRVACVISAVRFVLGAWRGVVTERHGLGVRVTVIALDQTYGVVKIDEIWFHLSPWLYVASFFFETLFMPLAGGFDMFGVFGYEIADKLNERKDLRIVQEFLGVFHCATVSLEFKDGAVLRVF